MQINLKGKKMTYDEWLQTYADEYVMGLPENYRYDLYEDFMGMLDNTEADECAMVGYLDSLDLSFLEDYKEEQ
jgi:hypothetical protein